MQLKNIIIMVGISIAGVFGIVSNVQGSGVNIQSLAQASNNSRLAVQVYVTGVYDAGVTQKTFCPQGSNKHRHIQSIVEMLPSMAADNDLKHQDAAGVITQVLVRQHPCK
jgi:hypothetical protein